MSLKRKIFSFITLLFAIIALTTFVSAQEKSESDTPKREMKRDGQYGQRGFGEGKRGNRGFLRMLRGLELTEDQNSQIKTLMETQKAVQQPLREEGRELMLKRRDGSITESEQERLKQIHTEMKASNEQLKITILGLLTPEQNAKIEQMKAEREQRMQERRRRWQERKQQKESAPADQPIS